MRPVFLLPTGLLLVACQLTATDVEPDLPGGRIEGGATVAYHAAGQPVVAVGGFNLGVLLGGSPYVTAQLRADSTLTISATDIGSLPAQTPYHILQLVMTHFRGVGTYAPGEGTSFRVVSYDAAGHPFEHAAQVPVAGITNQLVVTDWTQASQVLRGTFELRVAGPTNPQTPNLLSDGRFDVDVK